MVMRAISVPELFCLTVHVMVRVRPYREQRGYRAGRGGGVGVDCQHGTRQDICHKKKEFTILPLVNNRSYKKYWY